MALSDDILRQAVEEAAILRTSLIRRCKTDEDAIAVATAFALEAEHIYEELGGSRMAAAQFYRQADKLAVKQ